MTALTQVLKHTVVIAVEMGLCHLLRSIKQSALRHLNATSEALLCKFGIKVHFAQ